VWDVVARKQLRRFKIEKDLDRCIALAGPTLLGLDDGVVRLWNTDTGKYVTLTELQKHYWSGIAVDPTGRWMALVDDDGLFVHDLVQPGQSPRILRHHTDLTTAAFSPRGDLLATADNRGMISIWTVTGWRLVGRITAHGSVINALAFSPDGSMLASTSADKTVRLWNPSLASERTQHIAATACAAAPDGTWLAVATPKSMTIHNPASPEAVHELEFADGASKLMSLHGGALLLVEKFSEILLCDANDWRAGRSLEHPDGRMLKSVTCGGSFVCATDSFGRAFLWDIDNWGPPKYLVIDADSVRLSDSPPAEVQRRSRPRRKRPATADIIGATVAPSGDIVVVGTTTAVFVITPGTGEVITAIPAEDQPTEALISPDGRWLVLGDENALQVWNTNTWAHQVTLTEVDTDVAGAAWAPDNSLFAVVTADQVVRIYDSDDWQCLTSIRLDGTVAGCDWAGNTDLVVVGGHGVYRFDFCGGSPDAEG
jgi:WD40 repeat protein